MPLEGDANNQGEHPGIILSRLLRDIGMRPQGLANLLRLPLPLVARILAGKQPINKEIAGKLAFHLDVPATFWICRQKQFNRILMSQRAAARACPSDIQTNTMHSMHSLSLDYQKRIEF